MNRHAAFLSPLLGIMTAASRKAAHSVLRDFREVGQLQVSLRGTADFVSSAERRASRVLREELVRARPNFGFFTEESGAIRGDEADHYWIIDAIDGTLNFLHGFPAFSISLALSYRGEIVCGVIYDPVPNELFYAEKGKGAYLNEKRMRVSARLTLGEALVASATSGRRHLEREQFLRELALVASKVAGLRQSGCTSLNLAYIAAGRFDGYWERNLHAWDIAAGLILVREAGGIVSELLGGNAMLKSGEVLAANSSLHRSLMDIIREANVGRDSYQSISRSN